MARAVRLCPSLVIVRPDFSKYQAVSQTVFSIFRSVTPLVEPLSLDEAYLDVTENAWGEPLGRTVAQRLKARDSRSDGADGVGRRRAQQVPREDRVGVEEAGRPDGDRARAGRSSSCRSCRWMRLWGVGPGHRDAAARARHRARWSTCAPRRCGAARGRRAATPSGCAQLADGIDDRAVVPNRDRPSRRAARTRSRRICTDIARIRAGDRRDGARRRRVARAQATCFAGR